MEDNSYLSHHGVKGMRWGVRKDPKASSRNSSTVKDRIRTRSSKVKPSRETREEARKKRREPVSDEVLRQRIQRIRLEQEYAQLVARGNQIRHPVLSRGSETAQNILFGSVQRVGSSYVTQRLTDGLQYIDPGYKPLKSDKKDKQNDKTDDSVSHSFEAAPMDDSDPYNILKHQAVVIAETLDAMLCNM